MRADESPDAAGLRQRVVAAAALVAALTFAVMIGAFYIAQQYLQVAAGYSALGAAAALTLIALLVAIGAPLAGRLVRRARRGPDRSRSASCSPRSALGVLAIPGVPLDGLGALPLLVPFGLGLGMLFVPASRAALNAVPQAKHGRVSSLLSTARLLGAGLGAVLGGRGAVGRRHRGPHAARARGRRRALRGRRPAGGGRALGPRPDPRLELEVADRAAAEVKPSRKVRTPQGRVVGSADPGKPEGKCHRNDTA